MIVWRLTSHRNRDAAEVLSNILSLLDDSKCKVPTFLVYKFPIENEIDRLKSLFMFT